MPIDYNDYPTDWKTRIRPDILNRAGHCCEGSPQYPDCRVPNYSIHPETGSKVVLTIAHLNHDINDSDYNNLRAWCQRCHNTYDAEYRKNNIRRKRRESEIREGQQLLFESCKFDCGFEVKFGNPELTHEEISNKAKELHEENCFFCKD